MRNKITVIKPLLAFFIMGILFLSSPARAEELPFLYRGIRPLGMGGAFTAVADDENALIYNPAGLPHRGSPGEFSILLPTLEVSRNTTDLISDVKRIADITAPAEQTKQVTDLIGNNLGENFRLKLSLFPNLLLDRTGIGLLAQTTVEASVHNPLGSNVVRGKGKGDLALMVSHAQPREIRGRPITIGVTAKAVHREVFDRGYTLRELAEEKILLKNDLKKGTGGALDVGFLYPLQGVRSPYFKSVSLEPTVGLALQNVVGSRLGDAGELPFQANIGIALRQQLKSGKLLLAGDIMDLTFNVGEDNDFAKRLHMGVEYQFPHLLALRTGLYQGYPSFGATLDFWIIQFAYAYYVEEIGAFSGQIANPRHVVKISLF